MKTTILKTLLICITTTLAYGQQWELVGIPNDIEFVTGIHFMDENTGWIVGNTDASLNKGTAYLTIDGGVNWNLMDIVDDTFEQVYFKNYNEGFIVGWSFAEGKRLYKTDDGGDTWSENYYWAGGYIRDIAFYDENLGYAVGSSQSGNGKVIKTTDGGTTWTQLSYNFNHVMSPTFVEVQIINENTVYLLDNKGYFLYSTDQGESWQEQFINETSCFSCFNSMDFPNESNGIVITNKEVYYTDDAGLTWVKPSIDVSQFVIEGTSLYDFESVHFVNNQNGFIVGSALLRNLIYKTSDGGNTWELDYFNDDDVTGFLHEVFFLDPNTGWAGGKSSVIGEKHILKYTGNLSTSGPELRKTIQVSPNPAQDQIAINNTSNSDITQVEIYNLLGAKVDEITINSLEAVIDVSTLKAGTYFFKIYTDGGGAITKKIIKR